MNLKRSLGTALLGLIALGLGVVVLANILASSTPVSQAAEINPYSTHTPTRTRTATLTRTATRTATSTATRTATHTAMPTHTATHTRVPEATHTATSTRVPEATHTATSTHVPEATHTATSTHVPEATHTATSTHVPEATHTATSTHVPEATHTATVTKTPMPSCNGDINIVSGAANVSNIELCAIHLHASGFSQATINWVIKDEDNNVVLTGTITLSSGSGDSALINTLADGKYAVYWQEDNCTGLHEHFTIECPQPTHTPMATHTATATHTPHPTHTAIPTSTNEPTATVTPEPTATTFVPGDVVIIPDPSDQTITLEASGFGNCDTVEWSIVTDPGGVVVYSGTIDLVDGAGSAGPYDVGFGKFQVIWTACRQHDEGPVIFQQNGRPPMSYVSVKCQGCWGNTASLWVGGTAQTPQALVLDTDPTDPAPAALWVLWNIVPWQVTVQVSLPAGLDPARWKFIYWTGTGPSDYIFTDTATFTLNPSSAVKADFQLVDTAFWP